MAPPPPPPVAAPQDTTTHARSAPRIGPERHRRRAGNGRVENRTTGVHSDLRRALLGGLAAPALTPVPDDAARSVAARFAADFLSWDEDAPQRHYQVLAAYFSNPAAAVLGWNGRGRQHADLVIPGVVTRLSPQQVVVEITVRVVLHERTIDRPRPTAIRAELTDPPPGLEWAAAGAAGNESWRATATAWTTLHVPVGRSANGELKIQPRIPVRPVPSAATPS